MFPEGMKAFLLGAGASVDAGLPTSVRLTRLIADHIDEKSRYSGQSRILHAVIGAMIRHDTANSGSAFDGVDVERVFAAVTTLAKRESLDLAAFVDSWDRNLDGIDDSGRTRSAFWDKHLHEAVVGRSRYGRAEREPGSQSELKRAFEDGVKAVVGDRLNKPDSGPLLDRLAAAMLNALINILEVDPSSVGYLAPLVTTPDLAGIATLNYDLSVEHAIEAAGLSCTTGLDLWTGGYDWDWGTSDDIRLLKLHGSLDYLLGSESPTVTTNNYRVNGDVLMRRNDETGQGYNRQSSPALVFGQGSKLRSDGPFLAMLVEFDRMLREADWLTVVGYSFRDEHINAALARWVNGPKARRLTVIDLSAESWEAGGRRTTPPFLFDLLRGQKTREYPAADQDALPRSLEIDLLSVTAAEGIARLPAMFDDREGV